MTRPRFTLTVAATRDGFIARAPGHAPTEWVSPEEQTLFLRDVEAADWSIMGRGTHEAAPRADRRRIVFSTEAGGWRTGCQFWCDPAGFSPADLAQEVRKVHPLRQGLILGGTRVHDWFSDRDAIDRIHLTVEPVTWGEGLPIFTGAEGHAPLDLLQDSGFRIVDEVLLNARGTMWYAMTRNGDPAAPGMETVT